MTRKSIKLGIALLATLAMSAVAASAASADPEFHILMEDTTLTGAQITPNVLTTDLGEFKCETIKYVGTQGPFTSETLTLKPIFEKCKFGAENATVTVNGCAFLFHLAHEEPFEAFMDIECPAGEKLVIHTPGCSTTIPPQNGLKNVTFTNEGEMNTRALKIDLNVEGIDYIEHGGACANETVTTTNGTYVGLATVTGENGAGEHKPIWVE
jgi:hypothetical protein